MSRTLSNDAGLQAAETCHLCGARGLREFVDFRRFCRVTSDCRPWPVGGRLYVCPKCHGVQKAADAVWRQEVAAIYREYTCYSQGEGAEQAVFEQPSGRALPRSRRLLESLSDHVRLPKHGRMLDIGCGNGAMLRAFSEFAPGWTLAGTELSDRYASALGGIERVEPLYTCAPDQVPEMFDLISLVHVLEHVADPGGFLAALRPKLKPGGLLLLEMPHHAENPFELLIADHCTHFSPTTAAGLVERSEYAAIAVADDWVPKELTVVATASGRAGRLGGPGASSPAHDLVARSLDWLRNVAAMARELSGNNPFGLFGTSIAASWLFGELAGTVQFFVDEDRQRAGRMWLDRPIYLPDEVPRGSHVLIALPNTLAEAVFRRIAQPDATFHLPPPPASRPMRGRR